MLRGPPGVEVGLQGGSGVLSVMPLPTLAVCKGQAYAASSHMGSLSKWKDSDPMRWFICLRCRLAGPLRIMPEAVHCGAAHPFNAASSSCLHSCHRLNMSGCYVYSCSSMCDLHHARSFKLHQSRSLHAVSTVKQSTMMCATPILLMVIL